MLLVIDDHADTRRAVVLLLRAAGYQAADVSTGEEGLAYMAIQTPSLVLCDYAMPGMNGLEVLKMMKADDRLKDIPVIMFSAHDGELEKKALVAGAAAYILKGSLDWAHIQREIERLIGPGTAPLLAPPAAPPIQPARNKDAC